MSCMCGHKLVHSVHLGHVAPCVGNECARICVQVSMAEHLRTSEVTGMIEPSCLILAPKLE